MKGRQATLYAVPDLPLIGDGDNIPYLIFGAATRDGFTFEDQDVVVIAHKIISKAEGAVVRLAQVKPSQQAIDLAVKSGRDPRLCQVVLDESAEILGVKGKMIITRHKLGFECTQAGVDRTNVGPKDEGVVSLLPRDPDASARRIRKELQKLTGKKLAVIISDSFGKPDREGAIGVAIGIAGIRHLEEQEKKELFGNKTKPAIARADEIAAAASILMGQTDERLPVVVVRGVHYTADENASIQHLLTNQTEDDGTQPERN